MSEKEEIGSMSGSAAGHSAAWGVLSAIYGPTGREIRAAEDYDLARRWAESKGRDSLSTHAGFQKLKQIFDSITIFPTGSLGCYRGRPFSRPGSLKWNQFGPPPMDAESPLGRYGLMDSKVLYLCESKDGVLREPLQESDELWVQKFVLPLGTLKLADISNKLGDDYLNCIFWFAELAGNEGTNIDLEFSQFVAEYFATRFDGMVVPGVRGDKDFRYRNIIIFKPEPIWKDWVHKSFIPERIR